MSIKLYIEDIAAYNNGRLRGCWIDCADGFDDCMDQIKEMLDNSPEVGAEEWQISDADTELFRAEDHSIKTLCDFVEEAGDMLHECILYFNDVGGDLTDAAERAKDAYIGEYSSFEEYAEQVVDETMNIPDDLLQYFDYKAFTRDIEHDYIFVDGYVFHNH